jgi:hypothetical protein
MVLTDHDRLFKELLTNFFREFVELFAPEVASRVAWDTVRLLDKEVWTDVTEGERHEADLVALAEVRGEAACFLIHIESQASKQSDFGQRMFHYFARLHEKYRLPVYPIALFSYDKPRKAEPEVYRVQCAPLNVLEFRFHVVQLNRLDWRDYAKQQNPVAAALMAKMNIAPQERAKVKFECLRLLLTLKLDPARMQLISGFVDSYLKLNAEEESEFMKAVNAQPPRRRKKAVQLMGNWMEAGWKTGRHEEAAHLVLRLLPRRVGPLSQTLQKQVRELSLEQLEELAEALFDLQTRADLEAWLAEKK